MHRSNNHPWHIIPGCFKYNCSKKYQSVHLGRTREWYCMCWPQTAALSLSFQTNSSLVLCSAGVLVITGNMRRYLQSNEDAQVGQLLHDDTYIHAVARRFAFSQCSRKSMEETPGQQEEHRQSPTKWPPAGYRCACFWSNCQKQTPWGWHEGLTSSSGTCAHSPAVCSSIGICQRTPELAGLPLEPHSPRLEQVHTEHMWQAWKSLEMPWWTLCCL